MNDGTSLKSVKQIRRTEYQEYNLGNTRTNQINNLFGFTCEASLYKRVFCNNTKSLAK